MSRSYEMNVEIGRFNRRRREKIQDAVCAEWPFEDWFEHEGQITANGGSQLCGGETEAQFANRLARAVFKANGKPCSVAVHATCMEDLPCESYSFDKQCPPKAEQRDPTDRGENERKDEQP